VAKKTWEEKMKPIYAAQCLQLKAKRRGEERKGGHDGVVEWEETAIVRIL